MMINIKIKAGVIFWTVDIGKRENSQIANIAPVLTIPL